MDYIDKHLKAIIVHANNKVPYYYKLFNQFNINPDTINSIDDFRMIPVLTKDIIQNKPEEFLSKDYHLGHDDISEIRTSGSTGKFLKIYWSREDTISSLSSLFFARAKLYGIFPDSNFCTFHSFLNGCSTEIPDEILTNEGRILSFSKLNLDNEHLQKYYNRILEFNPKWIYGQPSTVLILAQFIQKNNLKIPESIEYIELTGELLFNWSKKVIRDVFNVPVINMYGSVEVNGIAIECTKGSLHCLENNVFVEILKDGKDVPLGNEGEIYITSLTNKTMPFLRYAIGDRGVLHPSNHCSCGRKGKVLELLAGRLNQYAFIEGKEPISCFIFYYAIENINEKQGYPVIQFQVIQESYTEFVVKLVIDRNKKFSKGLICKQFKEDMDKINIKNVKWNFIFENDLFPCKTSGKLQFFTNNIKSDKFLC